MKSMWKNMAAIVGATMLSLSAAHAQDGGALVDALVKKGILTDQEGEQIRADLAKDFSTTPAGKLNLSSSIKGLRLYGDARFRYEVDRQESPGNGEPVRERDRNRYRLRLGAEYAFTDNFKAGVQLATSPSGNSTNVDFGGVSGAGNGAFDKGNGNSNGSVFVDLLYLTYSKSFGLDWLEMTGGRQKLGQNITTGWTWDSDINPEGGLVKLGEFKLGNFSVASTHGAYIYGDVIDNNTAGLSGGDDTWMFINQVDFSYKFSPKESLRISPAFLNFAGSTFTSAAASATLPQTNSGAGAYDVRGLNVFFINGEFKHALPWELTGKLYGDYGVNLSGASRASKLSASATNAGDGRNQFGLVGYQIGKGKGKGSWTLDLTGAYYEAYSWDPSLADSDFNGGRLNSIGFGIKPSYYFTDNIVASVNYRHSNVIDTESQVPVNGAAGVSASNGNLDSTDLVQVDLNWKF